MTNTNHSYEEYQSLIKPITDISETHYYNKRYSLQNQKNNPIPKRLYNLHCNLARS